MAFTLGFYSFNVSLNDSSRGLYTSFRVKTARHPNESLEHLYARVIALGHSYEPGLEFSQGLFEEKEPTIWKRDLLGQPEIWIQLGVPDRKKLERVLKAHPHAIIRIYFWEPEQLDAFCWMLRGSRTNWVEQIQFYSIEERLLSDLAQNEKSSSSWNMTFMDSTLYLSTENGDFTSTMEPIDIWDAFQVAIQNHEVNA